MYGIVNKAIEELVTENYGKDKWDEIKEKSGVDIDYFISNEPYDDDITYKLAGAASQVMGVTIDQVLIAFGEWWVMRTVKDKYGSLMDAGGNTLKEFIINLPVFHNRVMMIYPKLTPPEFKISHLTDEGLHLHYFSKRAGLKEFVRGLLQGLSKSYNTPMGIELIESRDDGQAHEVYKLTW